MVKYDVDIDSVTKGRKEKLDTEKHWWWLN